MDLMTPGDAAARALRRRLEGPDERQAPRSGAASSLCSHSGESREMSPIPNSPGRVSLFMQTHAASVDTPFGTPSALGPGRASLFPAARAGLALAVMLAFLLLSFAARADALDDTLALFVDDKFPQTEQAIGQLAAQAPPQAQAILGALDENRLMVDPASRTVVYKTADGKTLNAKTGEPFTGGEGSRPC